MNYFLATATGDDTRVLLTLFIMLVAAKLMAELFERLRQPAVAGEILAGVVIGPSVLGWAAPSEISSLLWASTINFEIRNLSLLLRWARDQHPS